MRVESNGTRYFSFEEIPGVNKKKDNRKEEQKEKGREKFAGHCRVCGETLSYVSGTNIMVCKNPKCKGVVRGKKDSENIFPVFRTLDNKGTKIAESLFSEVI